MVTKFLDKLVAKNAHREILRRMVYLTPSKSYLKMFWIFFKKFVKIS